MKIQGYIIVALLATSSSGVCAEDIETGKVIEEVQCKYKRDYSYMLYLPSSYTPDRAEGWPVLFAMDPRGGTRDGFDRYIMGAEKNNWIVAMWVKSESYVDQDEKSVQAVMDDVLKRFAVDKKRCYASGMSAGGRWAFWLANKNKSNIIGIIPCGAGDAGYRYSGRVLAYGLSGGYCFNRWDMAITFNERIRDKGRLRFFEGGHDWADEDLLFDAINWLNAKYLAQKGAPEEIDQFSKMLFSEIQEKHETDPYFAYENAPVLAEFSKAPHAAQAKRLVAQLEKDPRIKLYIQGLEAMDDFVDEHFNTDVQDYRNNRLTPRQKRDAEELLEKYGETPLAPIIRGFGEASDAI